MTSPILTLPKLRPPATNPGRKFPPPWVDGQNQYMYPKSYERRFSEQKSFVDRQMHCTAAGQSVAVDVEIH